MVRSSDPSTTISHPDPDRLTLAGVPVLLPFGPDLSVAVDGRLFNRAADSVGATNDMETNGSVYYSAWFVHSLCRQKTWREAEEERLEREYGYDVRRTTFRPKTERTACAQHMCSCRIVSTPAQSWPDSLRCESNAPVLYNRRSEPIITNVSTQPSEKPAREWMAVWRAALGIRASACVSVCVGVELPLAGPVECIRRYSFAYSYPTNDRSLVLVVRV